MSALSERLVIALERLAGAAEVAAQAHAQLAMAVTHVAEHGISIRGTASAFYIESQGYHDPAAQPDWRIEFNRE